MVAASERKQEGEQGRPIAREGDRAKREEKKKKRRAEIPTCGREIGAKRGEEKKGKVQLHLGSKTEEKDEQRRGGEGWNGGGGEFM